MSAYRLTERQAEPAALIAAFLAFASAAVTLYWLLGGTAGLETVGGEVGGVLTLYGGVLVVIGALVLAGVIDPTGPVDEYALRWHVFFWDLWFFVWGVALLLAAVRAHRRSTGQVRSRR